MPSSTRGIVAATVLVGLAFLVSCSEDDTTPPAAPIVDPIDSPNRDATPLISGTAEFGSTVRVDVGGAVVETTADPYTARWFAEVELDVGDNAVSVTATDAAGNQSAATVVGVVHVVPGAPALVTIDGPATGRADQPVVFEVHVFDDFGDEIPGAAYTLTTDATPGTTTVTPPATISFCELGATAVTAQAGDGGPSATHTIDITPGRPEVVALTLSDNAVTAGTSVTYTTAVIDGCANPTTDFVDVFTNAPGAVAAGGTITGLTRAGSWTVVAQVPGTSVVDSETLLVDADASSTAVVLQLTQMSGFVGVPIGYTVTAIDGFGNPVSQASLEITSTDLTATVDPSTQTITFGAAGTHTVTATLFGGTADQVSDGAVVLITDPDLAAPTVAIIDPPPVPQLVVAPGGVVTVTVRASDDRGLSQIFLQASGGGMFDLQQRLVPLDPATGLPEAGPYDAVFAVDVDGGAFGDVELVAQAVDTSGNMISSVAITIRVDPAAGFFVSPGVTIATIGWRGNLRRPRGVATDPAGTVFVTNNDDAFPLVVSLDPASPPPDNQSVFVVPQAGRFGEDLVFYDDPDVADPDLFFLSYQGTGDRIARIDAATGALLLTWSADIASLPRGLVAESSTRIAALFDDGIVRRYNPTSAGPNVGASDTIDASANLGDGWGLELLASGCNAGQYTCGNGACIDRALVCNAVSNCGDGTDEGAATCTGFGSFRCANGAGTAVTNICDGGDDCADGTLFGRDEASCRRFAVADNAANEAWRFYDNGAGNGSAFDQRIGSNLDEPRGVALSPGGRYAYVASRGGNRLVQIDLTQNPICDSNCPTVVSGFDEAWGVVFSGADLLVTDHAAHAVYRIQGLP